MVRSVFWPFGYMHQGLSDRVVYQREGLRGLKNQDAFSVLYSIFRDTLCRNDEYRPAASTDSFVPVEFSEVQIMLKFAERVASNLGTISLAVADRPRDASRY